MKKITIYFALICFPFLTNAQVFQDGFEAGNINKWTLGGGNYSKRDTTSNHPATGNYCLETVGGAGHYSGLEGTFDASQPTEISWKIRIPSNSGHSAYFVVRDNNSFSNGILFAYHRDGTNTYLFYNSGANYEATISFNTWHSFKATNINWTSHTYDLYMDDSLVQTSYAFRENLSNISSVQLYNFTSSTAFYDDISIDGVNCDLTINSLASNNNPSSIGCQNCSEITVDASGTGVLSYVWNTTDTGSVLNACPITSTDYKVVVSDNNCSDSATITQNVIDARSPYPGRAIMCYNVPRRGPATIHVYSSLVQNYLNGGASCGACSQNRKRLDDIDFSGVEDIYNIYPNPAQNQITTEWFNLFNETVKIELVDMTGRVVKNIFEGEVVEGEMSLINTDVTTLPTGMYFMRYSSPSDVRVNKVQVMR